MDSIKNYHEKELVWYIVAYLLFLSYLPFWNHGQGCFNSLKDLSDISEWLSSVLIAGVISSLSFVFMNIYPQGSREVLVFFNKNGLPGKNIFSKIKKGDIKDIRIDNELALKKYDDIINNIPEENNKARKYENNKWYIIYNKYVDDNRVLQTHRDNLLGRDIYLTTLAMVIFTGLAFVSCLLSFNWLIVGYLAIMLIVTNMVARFNARRFVETVIAVDLANKKEE